MVERAAVKVERGKAKQKQKVGPVSLTGLVGSQIRKKEPKWGMGLMMKVWAPRGGLDRSLA